MVKTILIIFPFVCIYGCHGVLFRDFTVPQEVRSGENITLKCQVDTWPRPLYSLAWWKDGAQFYRVAVTKNYRYVDATTSSHHPMSSTAINFAKLYSLPGLNAKAGRRMGEVILHDVEASASGTYTCEAVADFPTFSQNQMAANMTVVEPPATRPIISGFKGRYYPGEVLMPNCTVLRSFPAASITWFVNGKKMKGDVIEVRSEPDMTYTLIDRLTLRLRKHHFQNGIFNLTCGALVGESLWSTTSITARHALPRRQKETRHAQSPSQHDKNELIPEGGDHRIFNLVEDEGSRPYQRLHSGGSAISPSSDDGSSWPTLISLVIIAIKELVV